MNDPDALAAQHRTASIAAKRLYTKFMLEIEPDLIPSNIPLLKWKYANETEAERQARLERYGRAFQKLDATMEEFLTDVSQMVRDLRKNVLTKRETKAQQQDQQDLEDMESRFSSL